jgi:hypothetical protein
MSVGRGLNDPLHVATEADVAGVGLATPRSDCIHRVGHPRRAR